MQSTSASKYIPVGRTSLVKKGSIALQVQTEYAFRPYPRVTTTISNNGQVIHKVEKKLLRPVLSLDEQSRMELVMSMQHKEIVGILNETTFVSSLGIDASPSESDGVGMAQRLSTLPGVVRVCELDNEGRFVGDKASREFKRAFSPIFRNLRDLMEVFTLVPGADSCREKGVYEVEHDRLYFASSGTQCFFLIVEANGSEHDYEAEIRQAVLGG